MNLHSIGRFILVLRKIMSFLILIPNIATNIILKNKLTAFHLK